MAIELPSPRLGGRGRAHHRDVVEPLAVLLEVVVVQLAQRVVQLHDVAREGEPPRAERRAQQAERRLALRLGHRLEADALAHVEVLVHPLAPLGVVDAKRRPRALVGGERGQPLLGGKAHRRSRDTRRAKREQARHRRAVGRDALEGLGQPARLGVGRHLEKALGAGGRGRALRDGEPHAAAGGQHRG